MTRLTVGSMQKDCISCGGLIEINYRKVIHTYSFMSVVAISFVVSTLLELEHMKEV